MDDSAPLAVGAGTVHAPYLAEQTTGVNRWVLSFEEAGAYGADLLGRKGAGLAEMTSIGLPVPPGFTITTDACQEYQRAGGSLPEGLMPQVREAMEDLEETTGKRFGDPTNPLLVSARSGAAVSMPGMMDTILNLGINQDVAEGMAIQTRAPRFAFDTYRRFIEMFGKVAMAVDGELFERVMEEHRNTDGLARREDPSAELLREIIEDHRGVVDEATGRTFPNDPYSQLELAIKGVFESWNSRRANEYRSFYGIPNELGTAVTVMAMVFGNADEDSGTGVLFTRNPATGESSLYGECLANAQGEDVVAGTTTPGSLGELAIAMPEVYSASWTRQRGWRATTATPRTSSLPSRRASSISCRRVPQNAVPGLRSRWPWPWLARG